MQFVACEQELDASRGRGDQRITIRYGNTLRTLKVVSSDLYRNLIRK